MECGASVRNYQPKQLPNGELNPRWHKHSGPSGKRITKFARGEFVAWDGEGLDGGAIDEFTERDLYVLLANSRGATSYNERGLSSVECLELLLREAAKYPEAIHVVYGANYDFQHIIHDIPHEKIEELSAPGHHLIQWGSYRLALIPGKRLTIQKWRGNNCIARLTLWDVLGFFQCSFLAAISQWLGDDAPDVDLIRKGKQARGTFDASSREFLETYNTAELRALVLLMEKLQAALKAADLPLSQWHGAGAIAAAILRRAKVKDVLIPLPRAVEEAARYAFFGGRIELMQFGVHDGAVFHYDITSAYPHALRLLPNLAVGYWRHVKNVRLDSLSPWALIFMRWELARSRAFGPCPFRQNHGRVTFPLRGARWLWRQEIDAALEFAETGDRFEIVEAREFVQGSDARPFAFVEELYKLRREALRRAESVQYVWKLGLNSLYGKLAQIAGYDETTGKLPRYHNECYAGLITAICRATVYRAAMLNERAIISINTDGIYATEALKLPTTTEKSLGAWTVEKHDGIVAAQAGVYWTRDGDDWREFSRGFGRVQSAGESEAEREAFYQHAVCERFARVVNGWRRRCEHVYFDSRRFVTAQTALHFGGPWWGRWCGWYSEHDEVSAGRRLDLVPRPTKTKRMLAGRGVYPTRAARELIATEPSPNLAPLEYGGEPRAMPWLLNGADDLLGYDRARIEAAERMEE
jgi:hypothetical protein